MNINLKQLINILSNDKIDVREKIDYFNLFFSNRNANWVEKSKNLTAFFYSETKIHNKQKALIKILSKRLENESFEIFWCHYYTEPQFERYGDIWYDDRGYTISEQAYDENYCRCDDCDEIIHYDSANYINDYHYCRDCTDRSFYFCHNCDTYVDNDNDCGCESDHDDDHNLYAYNYRIALQNYGLSKLKYGIELELEVRSDFYRFDIVEELHDVMKKDAICKRDGSLCEENGFELVSTNADFHHHKNVMWEKFFKLNLHEKVKGYHGHQTGYHIHFSREPFTVPEMKRLNAFYHNPENRSFLVDISGRTTTYAKYLNDITIENEIETYGDDCKFRAINFNNTDTIEVRIFRSNLKPISFFRNLELVHSINQFILNSSESVKYTEYFDYLLNNPTKDYINLLLWLDDKEYFSHLEHIEDFKTRYNNFKNLVMDFKNDNQELILLESEDN
jgi:hypothetical protein